LPQETNDFLPANSVELEKKGHSQNWAVFWHNWVGVDASRVPWSLTHSVIFLMGELYRQGVLSPTHMFKTDMQRVG
jgi:hypothetical protein